MEHDVTLPDVEGTSAKPTPAVPSGKTIGGFTVLEELGFGGMGVVLAAYDADLDRKVAIKLLRERPGSVGDEARRQRFLREAQALARVSHPNIVPIYEVGVDDGRPFIAMEHIDGLTLGQWARDEPRSWREVVEVYVQAARGLAACHRAGLVHRDVKPANILIDGSGRVRVTDFGLVRTTPEGPESQLDSDGLASVRGPLDATLTNDGAVLGTPAYAAPEQLRGAPVDARADQFAFCVALFEALYGFRPGHGAVDPGRAVPASVEAAVRRGLDVDPGGRFESMDALIAALGAGAGAGTAAGEGEGRSYRKGAAVASVVVVAAAVVAWVALGGDSRSSRADMPAAAALDAGPAEAGGARARMPGSERVAPTKLDGRIALLEEEGNDALGAERVKEAIAKLGKAAELAKEGDPLRLARILNAYAMAYDSAGDRSNTRRQLVRALALYQRTERRNPALESDTHELLGAFYFEGSDNEKAREHFAESLRIYDEGGLGKPDEIANKAGNLAAALAGLKRFQEALPLYERAHAVRVKANLTDELPDSYTQLAGVHESLGNTEKAREYRLLRKAALSGNSAPSSGQ